MSDAATQRRQKRLLAGPQQGIILGPRELADVTLAEAIAFGERKLWPDDKVPAFEITDSGINVTSEGFRFFVAATLGMTTARDILWVLADDVRADTIKNCLKPFENLVWEDLLPPGTRPKVKVQAIASRLFHEGSLTESIEKLLPKGTEEGVLDVKLKDNRLRVALSLGGEPLYRRRFKPTLAGKASIKEDLAAALTRSALNFAGTEFVPNDILIPFAGSGTLGFEAATALMGIPPFVLGGERAIERLPCLPAPTLKFARDKLAAGIKDGRQFTISYMEQDAKQCEALTLADRAFREALKESGQEPPHSHITKMDATGKWASESESAFIAVNPPYGHRLGQKNDAVDLYRRTVEQILQLKHKQRAGFILGIGDETANIVLKGLSGWKTARRDIRHGGLPVWTINFAKKV